MMNPVPNRNYNSPDFPLTAITYLGTSLPELSFRRQSGCLFPNLHTAPRISCSVTSHKMPSPTGSRTRENVQCTL